MNIDLVAASHSSELLYANFNQDQTCLACGTVNGFAVFSTVPFKETFRRIFSSGGIGIVEMLYRCNLLALVGGGRNPRYPPNKVMIWDDNQNKCVGELMFKNQVHAVRLRRDYIVVALENKVYYYRFKDLKLLVQIPTYSNRKGLISMCAEMNTNVLAIPGTARGSVRVELFDINKNVTIQCHSSDLAQLVLSRDGKTLATASDKGTLIRLWDTHSGGALRELRRGSDRAEIYCLAFSPSGSYVACTSDKGTVHIFSLKGSGADGQVQMSSTPTKQGQGQDTSDAGKQNASMKGIGLLQKVIPEKAMPSYLHSEWSFAQLRGLEGKEKSYCAFDDRETHISVITADGTYTFAQFANGGEAVRVHVGSVLNLEGLEDEAFEEAVAGTNRTDVPVSVWSHPEAGNNNRSEAV